MRPLLRRAIVAATGVIVAVVAVMSASPSHAARDLRPCVWPSCLSPAPAPTPNGNAGGVRVAGNGLVNASGDAVVLHGVNRSGTEYACEQGWGIFDGPDDLASVLAIKSWAANAVRVPLNEDCWLGINGVQPAYAGANYINAIVGYVNLVTANGLYAILDMHWSAPGTTLANRQQPMPDRDHSPAFWRSVASTFKGNASVIFDLFNEPYPDGSADSTAAWACWKNGGTCSGVSYRAAGMQELVTTVRNAGAANVIMLGGVQYANALGSWLAYEPFDPLGQTAASFHTYNFNPCDTPSCWSSVIAPLARSVPVVTGEFGELDTAGTFMTQWMNWADPHGISYVAWTWDTWGCGGGGILISNYNGTPCVNDGTAYQQHLLSLSP